MKKNKATVYCRVAHFDENCMTNQVDTVTAFAKSEGYDNIQLFCDNGESGITLDRPAFNLLKAGIRKGKIKTIIVKDTARIARDLILFSEFIDEAEAYGVTVVTMNQSNVRNEFNDWLNNILKNLKGVTA